MTPWLLLSVLVALINLTALHVVRGRWGRISWALLVASLAGAVAGDAIGRLVGMNGLRLGDYHLLAACIGAQLLMIVTLLFAALLPSVTADDEPARRR